MYKCYCECCKCETPHDDIFDGIYSHCLSCGHLTFEHLCDDEELAEIYANISKEEKECDCCDYEIEL